MPFSITLASAAVAAFFEGKYLFAQKNPAGVRRARNPITTKMIRVAITSAATMRFGSLSEAKPSRIAGRTVACSTPGPRAALRRARFSRSFSARSARSCFLRSFSAFFASVGSPGWGPSSSESVSSFSAPLAIIGGGGRFLPPSFGSSAVFSSTKSSMSDPPAGGGGLGGASTKSKFVPSSRTVAGFDGGGGGGASGISTENTSSACALFGGALGGGRGAACSAPRSRLAKGSASPCCFCAGGGGGRMSSSPGSGTAPMSTGGALLGGGALEGGIGGGRKSIAVCSMPSSRPGNGTAPAASSCADGAAGGGAPSPRPGSGTAPFTVGAARTAGAAFCWPDPGNGTAPGGLPAPGGRPAAGAFAAAGLAPAWPGKGTGPLATTFAAVSPGLGRCTVNGFLHFGHLIESPAGGTRASSSSYAAEQFGQVIFTRCQSSAYSNRCLRARYVL